MDWLPPTGTRNEVPGDPVDGATLMFLGQSFNQTSQGMNDF